MLRSIIVGENYKLVARKRHENVTRLGNPIMIKYKNSKIIYKKIKLDQ
jgi:hypothetical protein